MLIDVCKNNHLFVLNGRYGKDIGIGKKTFRNNSVIDYIISSVNGYTLLTDFNIFELDHLFSDGHSLLDCCLNIKTEGVTVSKQMARKQNLPK